MDNLSPEDRKRCMSSIRSKDTKPEMIVRRLIHSMGFRYRLHKKDLPGKPDIVLSRLKKIIFVHGCFWHKHRCRYGKVQPKTNTEYWEKKRNRNVIRDKEARKQLKKDGWQVLVIWECWTKDSILVKRKISEFLLSPKSHS